MERTAHILIVDDDKEIRELLARFLDKHGLRVSVAADGREMKQALADWNIDLVVLDLMLPGEDGLTLCRNLRAKSSLPVIMLTAMGEETDRIIGLEMGADDYLAKPFNPRELLARIKAVLRRVDTLTGPSVDGALPSEMKFGFVGWVLDAGKRELIAADGMLVPLSSGEYNLLLALVEHPGRVLSRDQLLDLTSGREAQPFDRSVDVQISRLRRKIEVDPQKPSLIKTVRSGGYMFTPQIDKLGKDTE